MTITVHSVGRFKEVVFRDFEDEDVRARSGLLDYEEARELSERLRELSDSLWESEPADDNQAVLPFFGNYAAGMLTRRRDVAAGRSAVG